MDGKKLSGYKKKFYETFGDKAVSVNNISQFVRGLKIKDADRITKTLAVELGAIPKRNRFVAELNANGLYKVQYRKNGVTMIDSNCTEQEVEIHRQKFNEVPTPQDIPVNHPIKSKTVQREIDVVNYFYKEVLDKTDYYMLEDFHVALYDGTNDVQLWIPVDQKNYKQKLQLIKFFINRKRIDLSENKNVMYSNCKQIKGGYYLTGVMPNLHFHNNRVGFHSPIVGKEVSLETALRIWPKAKTEFAYSNQKILLRDIPKEKSHKRKTIDTGKLERANQRELRKIMRLETIKLTPIAAEQTLKMRIRNSKWYRTCQKNLTIQIGQSIRIDKSLRRERKERELQNYLSHRRSLSA